MILLLAFMSYLSFDVNTHVAGGSGNDLLGLNIIVLRSGSLAVAISVS